MAVSFSKFIQTWKLLNLDRLTDHSTPHADPGPTFSYFTPSRKTDARPIKLEPQESTELSLPYRPKDSKAKERIAAVRAVGPVDPHYLTRAQFHEALRQLIISVYGDLDRDALDKCAVKQRWEMVLQRFGCTPDAPISFEDMCDDMPEEVRSLVTKMFNTEAWRTCMLPE